MPVEITPDGLRFSGKASDLASAVQFAFNQDRARLAIDLQGYFVLFLMLLSRPVRARWEEERREHARNPATTSGGGFLRRMWDGGGPDYRTRDVDIKLLDANVSGDPRDNSIHVNIAVVLDLIAERVPGDFLKREGEKVAAEIREHFGKPR